MAVPKRYEHIDFTPTDGMRQEAERALSWREDYGRGGTRVGVTRANQILSGDDLSPDVTRRMRRYFLRHEVDKDADGFRPGEGGYPSAGRIAWGLWGGDPGQSWANARTRQMDAADEEADMQEDDMPYTIANPPEQIAALPDAAKEIWIDVFNSAWEQAEDEPEEEREEYASRVAWAAVQNRYEQTDDGDWVEAGEPRNDLRHLILEESVTDTSPVEFLRVGTFRDSNGKEVEIDDDLLDELVANFDAGAAGQDVPIDIQHEKAEAAGWVESVRRNGKRLVAVINWTKLGRELVGDGIYRYLSAYLDMSRKVLKSISLVNFPAIKGLAPVELSEAYFEESLDQRAMQIRQAFDEQFGRAMQPAYSGDMWICDVYESYVVTRAGDRTYSVSYEETEDGVQFAPRVEWTEVRQEWIPVEESKDMAEEQVNNGLQAETAPAGDALPQETEADGEQPEATAAVGVNLSEEQKEALREEFVAEERERIRDQVRAEFAQFEDAREEMFAEWREELREERANAQFAERVTSSGEHAFAVKADKIETFLTKLPKGVRRQVREFLGKLYEAGTVDLTEHGTSEGNAKRVLDPDMARWLRDWVKGGNSVAEFFELNADVLDGSVDDYDLREFRSEEK